MSNIAIQAENISKAYQLGEFSTGTLSRDIQRRWALMRGKEDPFLKIGETNDRTSKGTSDIVWSLKDINFNINQGDAVGIIGRNGAGKSTLLKVLSRVTSPTTGTIKVKGRIASLLEVGTGFHPELTGRENIFLNGAILGMRKYEIKRKFDEIVEFSGVNRYVDTPVKRYSSGMYVRLAFAVAAHLESEILIVDEVLAVGDAEFQKKCIGKMGDVSKGEGRTVLFVSHNMASVNSLCNTGILLRNGAVISQGSAQAIINQYVNTDRKSLGLKTGSEIKVTHQSPLFYIKSIGLRGKNDYSGVFSLDDDIHCVVEYEVMQSGVTCVPSIHLLDVYGSCILASFNANSATVEKDKYYGAILEKGTYRFECIIPCNFLNEAQYTINVFLAKDVSFSEMTVVEEAISFETADSGEFKNDFTGNWIGMIRPKLQWKTEKLIAE